MSTAEARPGASTLPEASGSVTVGSPLLVGELSEEQLLAAFTPLLPRTSQALVGNGDDCAVIAAPDGRYCVSTDVLVEGHHFRTDWSTGHDIGARAAAQNLADAASMGSRPVALVVSLVLPPTTPLAWVQDLARGMARACEPCGAGVVGGDLSAGESLVLGVTVHGDLEGREPVLRSGARPGDLLVHAGVLGRSAAGLALLSSGLAPDQARALGGGCAAAVGAFLAPQPPLEAGPALAEAGATAMMDVSDGLLRDAGRLAVASRVRIDVDDPLEPGSAVHEDVLALLEPAARLAPGGEAELLARSWVLCGGEDHGMLAAVPPSAVGSLPPGVRVIGRVLEDDGGARLTVAGAEPPAGGGWDHFCG